MQHVENFGKALYFFMEAPETSHIRFDLEVVFHDQGVRFVPFEYLAKQAVENADPQIVKQRVDVAPVDLTVLVFAQDLEVAQARDFTEVLEVVRLEGLLVVGREGKMEFRVDRKVLKRV